MAHPDNAEQLEALGGLGPSAVQGVLGALKADEEVLIVLPGMTGALVLTGHRIILVRTQLPAEASGVGIRAVPYAQLTDYRFTVSRRGGLFFARSGSRPSEAFSLGYERRWLPVARQAETMLHTLVKHSPGSEAQKPA